MNRARSIDSVMKALLLAVLGIILSFVVFVVGMRGTNLEVEIFGENVFPVFDEKKDRLQTIPLWDWGWSA